MHVPVRCSKFHSPQNKDELRAPFEVSFYHKAALNALKEFPARTLENCGANSLFLLDISGLFI